MNGLSISEISHNIEISILLNKNIIRHDSKGTEEDKGWLL
jgi:hypothetical protein